MLLNFSATFSKANTNAFTYTQAQLIFYVAWRNLEQGHIKWVLCKDRTRKIRNGCLKNYFPDKYPSLRNKKSKLYYCVWFSFRKPLICGIHF